MSREEAAARPRKKQRVGAIPPLATASTRARFAFGSRLPDTGTNLVKSNGKNKLRISTRSSHEHDVRSTVNHRKRRRPTSQDEDEATSDAKSSHRKLTVKTALPRQSSYLPAPTKVSALLSSSNIHTKSPSNGTFRLKNQESTKQGEVVADMATTEPEFWITRRKMMETALKELDAIETKALTSAGVAMLGEVLGHVLKHKTLRGLSPRQMLAFFASGGVVTGPVLHFWYGYLETQRVAKKKLTPNRKLLLDRLLFTPPMVAFTIFSLGIMRGSSPKASRENLSRVYWNALLMNWKVWTLTQWLSFHCVPPQFRVLWGNCVALWWNSYLSLTQK
ncbi:hypothetical protein F444_20098 [Phytophthora nicotianae P1976]|uniref:Uncharacterized protein n=1 Tax=Phytophthora nicotianae P1976 TaxID=1317066 RepID=A0A080Z5L7_PHYNI|nr:hypothetical protein F444_20098 [Phytophthora nicotianae P1976]